MKDILEKIIHMSGVHVNVIRSVCKMWKTYTTPLFERLRSAPCIHRKCYRKSFDKYNERFRDFINNDVVDYVEMCDIAHRKKSWLTMCKIGGNICDFLIQTCKTRKIKILLDRCIRFGFLSVIDKILEKHTLTFTVFLNNLTAAYLYQYEYAYNLCNVDMTCNLYKQLYDIIVENEYYDRLLELNERALKYNVETIPNVHLFKKDIRDIIVRMKAREVARHIYILHKNGELDYDAIIDILDVDNTYICKILRYLVNYGIILPIECFNYEWLESFRFGKYILSMRGHLPDAQVLDYLAKRYFKIE